MKFETLDLANDEGIATLTLNRPDKRNAINEVMVKELAQVLQDLADDKNTKVLLIQGSGDHFCAGADINRMQQMAAASYEKNYDDAQSIADLMFQLYSFPKPSIVLAHGTAIGGGLGLVAAADIALAAKDASFGFAEVKIGITPSTISPYVIAAIGERNAHYYFLTGERFGAGEGYHLGLIHKVTDKEALFRTGQTLAKTMILNSPNAMMEAKQLIRMVVHKEIDPQLAQKTAEHLARIRTSNQAHEGLKSFLEKRTPTWS